MKQDTNPDDVLLVLCTCPAGEVAHGLARQLVEGGHAACVNEIPGVVSTYRWQGEIARDEETLLLVKTSRAAYPALENRLNEIHPYELPEIVAVPITTGLPGYLTWVASSVR